MDFSPDCLNTGFYFNCLFIKIDNLISIPGETNQTETETADVERRSTAETKLNLPTESLGKIIDIIEK